jgi:hypothetical protein
MWVPRIVGGSSPSSLEAVGDGGDVGGWEANMMEAEPNLLQ